MSKMTTDLVRIVSSGGSVEVDATVKLTDDLVRIAAAAVSSGAQVIIRNSSRKMTNDLIRIALAGRGRVVFRDL